MEYLARVNPKYFAAIQLYAAVHDVRFYLNGVRIEPHPEKGAILVATNGHTLAVMHDPAGFCTKPLIVGDISRPLLAACKARGRSGAMKVPAELWIGESCAVVVGGMTASQNQESEPPEPFGPRVLHASKISLIEHEYANWRRVVCAERADSPATIPAIQARYLAQLHDAARILISGAAHAVHLSPSDNDGGLVMARVHGCPDVFERFLALLMPIRSDAPAAFVPAFLMTEKQNGA